MSEAPEKKPEDAGPPDHAGGPHEGPPGQTGDNPGQGGKPPPGQQDKPDKPEEPDEGEPHPEHPIAEPEDNGEEEKQPAAAAFVEPHLGFQEYVGTVAALRAMTPASLAAAEALFRGWMKREHMDYNGFYPREQWDEYYQRAMTAT
jgi:hypothetical protein